jgi:predicted nucleic acid-binding protein
VIVTTLVDSSVILDVAQEDQEWEEWSASAIATAAHSGRIVINPLIYAEVSCGYERIEELERALPADYFIREPLPWAAAFLAGRVFMTYRRRGGTRTSPMPDFYIGAHAAIEGYTLLTRDTRRYRAYFPKLRIVAP